MTPERNPHIDVLAWMMLMALAAVWGGSFFFAELALRELPPLSITLHRVFWAVPMLYFILRFKSLPSRQGVECLSRDGALNVPPLFLDLLGPTGNFSGSGLDYKRYDRHGRRSGRWPASQG